MTDANMGRSLQSFYLSTLVLTLAVLSTGMWWFWNEGPSQSSKVAEVYEASLTLDRMKDTKSVQQLNEMVSSDRVRLAVKKLAAVKEEMNTISNHARVEMDSSVEDALKQLSAQMNKLIEFPELSSLFLVLANKMSAFENYVVQNEWRTLTRLARRVNTRLEPAKVKSPGYFEYQRLLQTVGGIRDDMNQMKVVTTNSVLSSVDKNAILSRLSTMESEIEMLLNYTEALQKFTPAYTSFKNAWNDWSEKVSPELLKRRMDQERTSEILLYGVVLLMGGLVFAMMIGTIIYRGEKVKLSKQLEKDSISLIRDSLLALEAKESKKWSREFDVEFTKYREYVHKRMSFGTIFQEATPFGAFLLDSNLQVAWANDLFWKCWNLERQNDSDVSYTWDYLQTFTNLGEDDPIVMALKQGIAGIYQIQIKAQGEEETAPFEMYVSPVKYAEQTRIMIFLYPLRSLEESLADQTKAVVGPVAKAMDAIAAREFEGQTKERLEAQFESAGITDLYNQIEQFEDKYEDRLISLENEITFLRNSLDQTKAKMNDLSAGAIDGVNFVEKSLSAFEDVKSSVISLIDYRYELEKYYQETVATAKVLFKDEDELLAGAQTVYSLLNENQKATASVSKLRDQMKNLRGDLDECRSRLSQSVDQALVFSKRDQSLGQLEQPLQKIKGELRTFEQSQASFKQIFTSLDVALSKMEMILEDHAMPDFTHLKNNFANSRERIESDMFRVSKLERDGEVRDEKVVQSLRKMFSEFQTTRKHLYALGDFAHAKPGQTKDQARSLEQ